MSDLVNSLSGKISIENSKVKPFDGFIFLCGGAAKPEDTRGNPPLRSVRDAIHRELLRHADLSSRIRVAEDYKDWSKDGIYNDLVEFERHLASLSSVIVVILESPGAIAELGIFSAIDSLRRKLLVFIDSKYYLDDSFIRLGPIDYLEKTFDNKAECHDWLSSSTGNYKFDPVETEALRPEFLEAIKERLAKEPKQDVPFNRNEWLHLGLLICDLINLFLALTIREIHTLLEILGLDESETKIRSVLFILKQVGLVVEEPRSAQRFYIGRESIQYIKYHKLSADFDPDRFRTDRFAYYEKSDKKRYGAIRAARSRS